MIEINSFTNTENDSIDAMKLKRVKHAQERGEHSEASLSCALKTKNLKEIFDCFSYPICCALR